MRTFVNIAISVEVIAFLISLIVYSKYKHAVLKYFPIYFGIIAFLEIYCALFYRTNNVWLFNILIVFEFNFLAFIFWNYFNRFNRKLLLVFLVVFNSVTIGNFLFRTQNFLVEPISFSYVLSYFLIVIMIILLLNQILESNVSFEHIHRNILFWLSLALLIYSATLLPLQAITSWENTLGEFRFSLTYVMGSAVMLKNIMFIFGFLWGKKTYTY